MNKMLSENGLALIKSFEGCRLSSYQDRAGIWTIGYGHTNNVRAGQTISELTAMTLLQADIMICEELLHKIVELPVTQGQFDALVSFLFNVGPGKPGVKSGLRYLKSGSPSTLLALLNDGRYLEAADQFPLWVYVGIERVPGLVRRRAEEQQLFLSEMHRVT
ncbi:lysozyme [Klebsiella michiganensis]|jgi:lysozyme|uniref:lysozyme n=1 Tax=Klebsiella michiganensis TaxID=1134687 RepID=UPI002570648D|nr:lysozyme [Klebsiella michiganensis]MDL4454988.1 lysozyme [Klebsiella michiganensis]